MFVVWFLTLLSILLGFIMLANKFPSFKNVILKFIDWLKVKIDEATSGDNGKTSHTKIINLVWGIGSFCLIVSAVLKVIKIPSEILFTMLAAMGVSGIQAVARNLISSKFPGQINSDNNIIETTKETSDDSNK